MATRRWVLFLLTTALISVLAGCSSGGTFNPQNATAPPAPGVNVAWPTGYTPPSSIQVGSTISIPVVVSNDPDPGADGVSWSLTCASTTGNCGTLCPPNASSCGTSVHTVCTAPSSCQAGTSYTTSVTYIPPVSLYGSPTQISDIVGVSTADNTKSALAAITVTGFPMTSGNYVLEAQGADANGVNAGLPNYQFAAVVTLDGNGNITGGEQTVNYYDTNVGALVSRSSPINKTGGSFYLGADRRGTITIDSADTDIGGNGVETFTFVYLNSSHALIAQMDLPGTGAATGVSASGTMDLQTSTAAPSGSYAFVASGLQIASLPSVSLSSPQPVALGGILNIDSPNTISGLYSTLDDVLPNQSGGAPVITSSRPPNGTPSGSVSNSPDAFGSITFELNVPFVRNQPVSPIDFTGYIVDATHIKLIESDLSTTTPFAATAGLAIAQEFPSGVTPGSFSGVQAISGPYVFGVTGTDLESSSLSPNTLTSAGMFFADGGATNSGPPGVLTNGNQSPAFNGNFLDAVLQANTYQGNSANGCTVNDNNTVGAQVSATFGGKYSIDSLGIGSTPGGVGGLGIGRVRAGLAPFEPQLCGGFSPTFLLYLTGDVSVTNCPNDTADNGCPALVIAVGNANYPFIGTGIAYQQASSLSFPPTSTGTYGLAFTQYSSSNGGAEYDGTAQMTVDSVATPSLSGIADSGSPTETPGQVNQGFTGTYPSSGCFATFVSTVVEDPSCYPDTLSDVSASGTSSSAFQAAVQPISVDFYPIDGSIGNPGGFFVETDWLQQMETNPGISPQVSFGYFAAQSPVDSASSSGRHSATDKRGHVARK